MAEPVAWCVCVGRSRSRLTFSGPGQRDLEPVGAEHQDCTILDALETDAFEMVSSLPSFDPGHEASLCAVSCKQGMGGLVPS